MRSIHRKFRDMMGPAGITVVLAMYWLTGVVEAASLPPDDQYSPQQPPYRRDVAQGPLGYPNWLKYQEDLTTRLEPPDYTRGKRPDFSRDPMSREDLVIRDLEILSPAPGGWKFSSSADVVRNSSGSAVLNLDVPEDTDNASDSNDDNFVGDDTFQDQGPGSVEVYKLDLHRENSLLVPHANEERTIMGSRIKSKIPKKATAQEILWKIKSIETGKTPLPSIFRKSSRPRKDRTSIRESNRKIKENHKDEVFAVGGVPELQVGCEGLEASERHKRSDGSGVKNTYDEEWENSRKYQDPVYRESTEPILLRVTPIVLDIEEEEPPSGEVYEEMDELLKLKKLESTSPKSTTRRWNRADIDPALEVDKHREERMRIETFPERGDLGPKSNGSGIKVKESIGHDDPERGNLEKGRFRRDTVVVNSPASLGTDLKNDKNVPRSVLSQTASLNHHRGGRRLLWVQYPERRENRNHGASSRHHQVANEDREDPDLWGFGETDGELSDVMGEADVDKLREAEIEKRRREYERRRQEELYKRRGGVGRDRQNHPEDRRSEGRDVNTEIERIRKEYERQLEIERRERERVVEERRDGDQKRGGEKDRRKMEETRRRQEEESRRRLEEEERKNRDPSHSRRQEEREKEERRKEWNRRRAEEERRRRFEDERNRVDPPSSLTRHESAHNKSISRNQHDRENDERKLRDYIERNHPIDPKKTGDHRRTNEQSGRNEDDGSRRYNEEQQRRNTEEERRRKLTEEHRRRQQQPDEMESRRQMEENRRSQQERDEDERRRQIEENRRSQNRPDEDERRRQMEEQRRRARPENRAMEEERRRRLEEEKKLRDYVRRNQPVIVTRSNNSRASASSGEIDSQEQRRTMEAARQWNRTRGPIARTNDGRIHGPSAPTNIGQSRHWQYNTEEMQRRQERLDEERRKQESLDEERRRETNRRMLEEEEHRREVEYQRAESRRREEERKRLEAAVRREEENRRLPSEGRRNSWQDYGSSRRPAGEISDREAEELRRSGTNSGTIGNGTRNRENEWWRRSKEREREKQEHEKRERQRLENERNSRINGFGRTQHENSRIKSNQLSERVRSGHDETEWKRREYARLSSLPVSARIILRPDGASQNGGRTSTRATTSTVLQPYVPAIGSRGNFDNDIDFPALSPNRPGLTAQRFPAPATSRPPIKSPGACVWAIVQCCPANNRLTTCFESMGCPGVNWDPSPCRGSLADAARAEIVRFYEAADERNHRF